MHPSDQISHQGVVRTIESGKIIVRILSASACSACHAKGACGLSDTEEKLVEVDELSAPNVKPGDTVEVVMRKELGLKAVLYAYFLPFVFVLITLIASYSVSGSELLSGLLSLIILVPYYFGLYFFRKKLETRFVFYISK
ncbi:MAG: SoxR reducing system RseC family protein [Bacteroidales bacterium]|jgi:sigma-E factor negative regulatory protein RseC|nr:SoxR reducing system RseC family protein [Bacteroidales bacterium]